MPPKKVPSRRRPAARKTTTRGAAARRKSAPRKPARSTVAARRRKQARGQKMGALLFWAVVFMVCAGVWFGIHLAQQYVSPKDVSWQANQPAQAKTTEKAPAKTHKAASSKPSAKPAPTKPPKETKPKPQKAVPAPSKAAKPSASAVALPKVAIVIDDVGENADSHATVALPSEITLAFLPEGELTTELAPKAHAQGHTILVHMPMAPKSAEYATKAGKTVLKPTDAAFEIREKMGQQMEFLSLFASGVNNHMGSAFTENEAGMAVMLSELKKRDLFFLDSRTTAETKAQIANFGLNVPMLERDVFLDHIPHPVFIEKQLKQLAKVAKKQGFAIAIGHTYPETTSAVASFAKNAEKHGVTLVKLADLLEK